MTIPGNIISAADMQFNKSNIIKKEYCANDFLTLHYSESGARLALALQSREERPHPRVSSQTVSLWVSYTITADDI
jgi:hypothetical protein